MWRCALGHRADRRASGHVVQGMTTHIPGPSPLTLEVPVAFAKAVPQLVATPQS